MTTQIVHVEGHCESHFAAVREAFVRNFEAGLETGASVAVALDGHLVVDLWVGSADLAGTRPWEPDTLVNVWSTTKGMTALCAHLLVDRGQLDLDAPVARYWPEFGQAGKEAITGRDLLCHRAGLPAFRRVMTCSDLFDWECATSALAEQEPWWDPGTKHGYHAITFGYLVGEMVRRISRRSLGQFFREEVAEPLGIDFHIGLGSEHEVRTANLIPFPPSTDTTTQLASEPESLREKVILNPKIEVALANTREWRAAEIPAGNGHGSARSLARIYGALAQGGELDGIRLLRAETLERAIEEQCAGLDLILQCSMRWGLGFQLNGSGGRLAFGPNARSFGHAGYGGSFGFADSGARVGVGYVMNRMGASMDHNPPPSRTVALVDAIYQCL